MLSQPDEYFIEAVSNASMDLFPSNTLTKFTNRLQQTINLSGDWVVGVQEIFYPIELVNNRKKISGKVKYKPTGETHSFSFGMEEGETLQKFVNKFNYEMQQMMRNLGASKPRKRRVLVKVHNITHFRLSTG